MSRKRRPRLRVGAKIGRDLTVLDTIDGGGRYPVYIVWNHRGWCPMACKVFPTAARARREARVLQAFDHPNIVRFLGLGQPPHLLMEFLEGQTLSGLIRSKPAGRLSVSDAVRMAMHLGAALTHVHERGFLHLDVKPSNVIIARGRPVLFDFGIARRRTTEPLGGPAGTDEYMSPEQCRGESVTCASDVYGLAVTLYEALSGLLPFPRSRRRRQFPQIKVDPAPLRSTTPSIPKELEAIVMACLSRDPSARPSSPAELLRTLHRFIRHGPAMWPVRFDPAAAGNLD